MVYGTYEIKPIIVIKGAGLVAKIIIVAGYARSLINFRGDLIVALVKEGHEVVALAPEGGFAEQLGQLGAQYLSVPMHRTGTNLFQDIHTMVSLIWVIKGLKSDIVLSYTIKPVIYGSLAARVVGIKNIYSMITGLGYAFSGNTIKQQLLAKLLSFLYQQAVRTNKKVYFQNPDDLALFHQVGILPNEEKAVLINGSGVDTKKFAYTHPQLQSVSFLLIARLLWDKGIGEFVEAARQVKLRYPKVCFKIVGPYDHNPNAIQQSEVVKWQAEGIIEYLGETNDVRPYLAEASVYVLPSYREGTPRSVLEAMAMGRPVITTDAPGCRETVVNGSNGFLVPIKDSQMLAAAMERFILNPALISVMGKKSREMAVKKYDVHKVNYSIMQGMGLVK